MKALVGFLALFFGGLLGVYVLLALAGIEGWALFLSLLALLAGGGGLAFLANDGLKAEEGYRKWRNTVRHAQDAVNYGQPHFAMGIMVDSLGDPVLSETYAELCRARARDMEEGDHSER